MKEKIKRLDSDTELINLLDERKSIIIYGMGMYGQCLVDYIYALNKEESIAGVVVTNVSGSFKEYRGFRVCESTELENYNDDILVIVAVSTEYYSDIFQVLRCYKKEFVCISERLFYEMNWRLHRKVFKKVADMDFCIAGFQKCGTSSLYEVLKEFDEIYLSDEKESTFFSWAYKMENPENHLIKQFYSNARENQKVGMVEPSFYDHAREIKQLFGESIKLIFVIRNPVKAMFSFFKMMLSLGGVEAKEVISLYESNIPLQQMFTVYLERRREMKTLLGFHYGYWLKQFYDEFPHEQIKVVLYEELIKNPNKHINDILQFIGVMQKYEKEFPHANVRDWIMADKEGVQIAYERLKVLDELRLTEKTDKQRVQYLQDRKRKMENMYQDAPKEYGLKMTDEQEVLAKSLFDKDVQLLQTLIGRDLSEIWNW